MYKIKNYIKYIFSTFYKIICSIFILPFYILLNNSKNNEENKVDTLTDYLNKYIDDVNSKYGKVNSVYERIYDNGIMSYTFFIEPYNNINEKELIIKTKNAGKGFINVNGIILNFSDLYFISFFTIKNDIEKDIFVKDTMEIDVDVSTRFKL